MVPESTPHRGKQWLAALILIASLVGAGLIVGKLVPSTTKLLTGKSSKLSNQQLHTLAQWSKTGEPLLLAQDTQTGTTGTGDSSRKVIPAQSGENCIDDSDGQQSHWYAPYVNGQQNFGFEGMIMNGFLGNWCVAYANSDNIDYQACPGTSTVYIPCGTPTYTDGQWYFYTRDIKAGLSSDNTTLPTVTGPDGQPTPGIDGDRPVYQWEDKYNDAYWHCCDLGILAGHFFESHYPYDVQAQVLSAPNMFAGNANDTTAHRLQDWIRTSANQQGLRLDILRTNDLAMSNLAQRLWGIQAKTTIDVVTALLKKGGTPLQEFLTITGETLDKSKDEPGTLSAKITMLRDSGNIFPKGLASGLPMQWNPTAVPDKKKPSTLPGYVFRQYVPCTGATSVSPDFTTLGNQISSQFTDPQAQKDLQDLFGDFTKTYLGGCDKALGSFADHDNWEDTGVTMFVTYEPSNFPLCSSKQGDCARLFIFRAESPKLDRLSKCSALDCQGELQTPVSQNNLELGTIFANVVGADQNNDAATQQQVDTNMRFFKYWNDDWIQSMRIIYSVKIFPSNCQPTNQDCQVSQPPNPDKTQINRFSAKNPLQ